jgi:hypothetical protein
VRVLAPHRPDRGDLHLCHRIAGPVPMFDLSCRGRSVDLMLRCFVA